MTKFAPGNNANPTGKPKQKPLTDALKYILSQPYLGETVKGKGDDKVYKVKRVGLPKKCTNEQAIARRWVQNALEGDNSAIVGIYDRIEGKVPQAVIGGPEDAPPIQTQDVGLKEVARRLAYILLSESRKPEDGANS